MPMNLRSAVSLPVAGALMLVGCAGHPQRTESSVSTSSGQNAAPTPAPETRTTRTTHRTARTEPASAAAGPNDMVGVASCDQYLSTYKACHRAAGIYPPDQIDAHYDAMRSSLLRDARDPAKRATLDQRCQALAKLLTDALHGKSCNAAPGSSSSTGSKSGAM